MAHTKDPHKVPKLNPKAQERQFSIFFPRLVGCCWEAQIHRNLNNTNKFKRYLPGMCQSVTVVDVVSPLDTFLQVGDGSERCNFPLFDIR